MQVSSPVIKHAADCCWRWTKEGGYSAPVQKIYGGKYPAINTKRFTTMRNIRYWPRCRQLRDTYNHLYRFFIPPASQTHKLT